MKPIYINGRFLTQPLSGMQRFALEMLKAIDKALVQDSAFKKVSPIEVLVPQGQIHYVHLTKVKIRTVGRLQGHLWEQIELFWAARNGILLNLTSCGPLMHRHSILVMHDAGIFVYPHHFSRPYRMVHQFLRPRLARKAKRLVTISAFSQKELSNYCNVPEDRFFIIGDSAEHILDVASDASVLERHGLVKGMYALTVGNQSPNKNINFAIKSFLKAAPKSWLLAVAGGGDTIFGSVQNEEDKRVVRLGRVSDAQLRALYENAGLFLFPSKYEGFGVPPLEAMSLGCPVLTSNATAMPEILGDAAAYFESNNLESFSEQITKICADTALRKQLTQAGLQKSATYSWHESADRMLRILLETH